MKQLKVILNEKFSESLRAVLPVAIIVIALCFSIAPVPTSMFMAFVIGAVLLVFGMSLFSLGADIAMIPIGERIGAFITKSRKLWVVLAVGLIIGIIITISEPDLQVLANQIPSIPNLVLIVSIAVGVGLFLVIALLRILFSVSISHILIALYAIVFGLAFFAPGDFLAVAFDAGGITTGPMTVPFIMAFGIGVSSIRSDQHASTDSFGMVAVCSVGPILTTLIIGLVYHPVSSDYTPVVVQSVADSQQLWGLFTNIQAGFPNYFKEVALALGPIALFFLVFQLFWFKMNRHTFLKIVMGLVYTYLGLVLFLTGVNVGFMPVGYFIGHLIAGLHYNWIILPIGMAIGYFIVAAEPAVHVLNKQVEELSSGAIPAKAMKLSLSIGVCISLGLSMLRLLCGIPIFWFLVPGYALALLLTFFVPKLFTAIAFDSGGVASGPMTATFLLPFAIGICDALGGNIVTDAFGVVAMVAMTPLITIQVLGIFYGVRLKRIQAKTKRDVVTLQVDDLDIIEI